MHHTYDVIFGFEYFNSQKLLSIWASIYFCNIRNAVSTACSSSQGFFRTSIKVYYLQVSSLGVDPLIKRPASFGCGGALSLWSIFVQL